jgi:aspartate/methionine/tyrosine aminotransferase
VERYKKGKAVILACLTELGITDVSPADGAFYLYADLGGDGPSDAQACAPSTSEGPRPTPAGKAQLRVLPMLGLGAEELCSSLLAAEGVALTPGTDFEDPLVGRGPRRVRLSFPGKEADVAEAMVRLRRWWPTWLDRVRKAALKAAADAVAES